jgi:hypothetical protein
MLESALRILRPGSGKNPVDAACLRDCRVKCTAFPAQIGESVFAPSHVLGLYLGSLG